jgi:predicted nucleic acid-binding protein
MSFEDLPVRANLFDASALVKIFSDEYDSSLIQNFFNNYAPTRYTTPFCLYEALNLLKSKWLHRKELTEDQYRDKSLRLVSWYRGATRFGKDIELTEPTVLMSVLALAEKHSIDISDAFQIQSVKSGYFSALADSSATLLVTADRTLATVARREGIKSWYFPEEPIPR